MLPVDLGIPGSQGLKMERYKQSERTEARVALFWYKDFSVYLRRRYDVDGFLLPNESKRLAIKADRGSNAKFCSVCGDERPRFGNTRAWPGSGWRADFRVWAIAGAWCGGSPLAWDHERKPVCVELMGACGPQAAR